MSIKILSDHLIGLQGTTKECLLTATTYLLIQKGYTATGIREITDLCRITSSSIYSHFPSKDRIVSALIERELDYCQQHLFSICQHHHLSSQERLTLFSETLRKFLRERQTLYLIHLLATELFSANDLFQSLIQNYINSWIDALRQLLNPIAIDPEQFAYRIFYYLHGTIFLTRIFSSEKFIDALCDDFIDLFSLDAN